MLFFRKKNSHEQVFLTIFNNLKHQNYKFPRAVVSLENLDNFANWHHFVYTTTATANICPPHNHMTGLPAYGWPLDPTRYYALFMLNWGNLSNLAHAQQHTWVRPCSSPLVAYQFVHFFCTSRVIIIYMMWLIPSAWSYTSWMDGT